MRGISFAVRSFLTGVARIVDFGGQIDSRDLQSENGNEADARAIYSDWLAVGDDIRRAGETLANEVESQKSSASQG